MSLPTQTEIFGSTIHQLTEARRLIGDARDVLNSDWRPGSPRLPKAAVEARSYTRKKIAQLENEIDVMKNRLYEAIDAIENAEPEALR